MNALAPIIGISGIFSFLFGAIWLITRAFKKTLWWGILTLLLFPFAIFVFPVVDGKLSRRPLLLTITGFFLLPCAGSVQQGSGTGLFFATLIVVLSIYLYRKWETPVGVTHNPKQVILQTGNKDSFTTTQLKSLPPEKSFRFGFNRKLVKIAQGITFDSNRFNALLQREQVFFSKLGEFPNKKAIAKLFDNSELIASMKNFNQKHFTSLMSGKVASTAKWQDEQCQLFIQMMKKKYQLAESQIIALLLYVYDEQSYANYNNSFDDTITETLFLYK